MQTETVATANPDHRETRESPKGDPVSSCEDVIVVVLDSEPTMRLGARGWAGREFFRGRWDATPREIAEAVGERLCGVLDVHAVYREGDDTCVVLRWDTHYSRVERGPAPSFVRETPASRAPTLVPPSRRHHS